MTSQELASIAARNLRAMADRVEAGSIEVTRVRWDHTGNAVFGPGADEPIREQLFTVRYWPVLGAK